MEHVVACVMRWGKFMGASGETWRKRHFYTFVVLLFEINRTFTILSLKKRIFTTFF